MNDARISELLAPFLGPSGQEVTAADLKDISMYIDMLLRWNARMNLTAIRDAEQIVTRHFGESLFAARQVFPERGTPKGVRVGDVGSGAGFPGLPIKLWAPHISLTLIESNQKKATFMREVVRKLILTNVDVCNVRAGAMVGTLFDVVTLRAVERFESVLPTAASLVAPGGRLVLLVGAGQLEVAEISLTGVGGKADFDAAGVEAVPVPLSESRMLAVARRNRENQGG